MLGIEKVIVARVFFVWVSVFNLFAVAVFWSFMADLFTSGAGQAAVRVHWRRRHSWSASWSIMTIWLSGRYGSVNR